MRGDAEKLIRDGPGQVPRIRRRPPSLDVGSTCFMVGRGAIGSVDKDIGVDDEHSAAIHCVIEGIAIRDVYQRSTAVEDWEFRQGAPLTGALEEQP